MDNKKTLNNEETKEISLKDDVIFKAFFQEKEMKNF